MKDKKDNKMDEARKSLPKGVVASGIFTDNDLRVLYVLSRIQEMDYSDFYKEHGYFHIANENLKKEAGISSNSSLDRSLGRLIEYGLISRTPGKRGKQSEYVYHADAANNFSMSKKNKKSKKKGPRTERNSPHSEKRTDTENQSVTIQIKNSPHLSEKSGLILKINDLQEIIDKAVEAVCAHLDKKIEELNANSLRMSISPILETNSPRSEANVPRTETKGALFEGEKKGGNEPNSLKMREGQVFDGENEPNSLRMSISPLFETNSPHCEKRTTDIDLDIYNIYHDDHLSGNHKGPGDPGAPYEEEKKKKIEKRNKEEIERLRRSIAFCDEAIAEALAAGNGDRYRELLHERTELASQRDELCPEDEYATESDAEIERMVRDQLNNGENPTDLTQPSINRYMQAQSSASSTAEPSQLTTSPQRRKQPSQPSLSSPPSRTSSASAATWTSSEREVISKAKKRKNALRAPQRFEMNRRSPRPPKRRQEQFLSA